MALIMCECGHADYDHHKGKCYGINELPDGKLEHCKCVEAKWRNLFEK